MDNNNITLEHDNPAFIKKAEELGALVTAKNKSYGQSISTTEDFLKILYPNGIQPQQYDDLGVIIRIFDKIRRIASGHYEDSWDDIAGYGILMAVKHEEAKTCSSTNEFKNR